jgi:hypothetical protein
LTSVSNTSATATIWPTSGMSSPMRPLRVAAAVPALVVVSAICPRPGDQLRAAVREQPRADVDVLLHLGELRLA